MSLVPEMNLLTTSAKKRRMSISKDQICTLLLNTLSPDNTTIQQTEAHLKAIDKQQGFTGVLIDIIQDKQNIPSHVRLVAAVHLKNQIANNWKNKPYDRNEKRERETEIENRVMLTFIFILFRDLIIINDQDKQVYRERLLYILSQYEQIGEESKIARQLSIAISKIARVDYHKQWPTLFQVLFEYLEKGNDHHKLTALQTIKYIVNELSSKRMSAERKEFYQVSNELFKLFGPIWNNSMNQLQNTVKMVSTVETIEQRNNIFIQQNQQTSVELLIVVSKILRRIIEHGFTQYQENNDICEFFNNLFNYLSNILSFRKSNGNHILRLKIDELIIMNQKIIIRAQAMNPLTFIKFLVPSLTYFNNQIVAYTPPHLQLTATIQQQHQDERSSEESLITFKTSLVQSLMYLRSIVDCISYQTEISDPDEDEGVALGSVDVTNNSSATHVAQSMIKQFFNFEMLQVHLRALVSNFLIITPEELQTWQDEPEQYIMQLDSDSHQYELKPCAYNLFILLMKHFHESCVQIVIEIVKYAMELRAPLTDQQVLLKESCYMTIGLGYYNLYEVVEFDKLFQSVFLAELQTPDARYKILTRRVCWLLGYWIPKIPEQLRAPIVSILLELVNHNDLVIALTGADSLKAYIDDYTFELDTFKPYVNQTILSLLALFKRCEEVESQTKLLEVLGVIFVQLNEQLRPYVASIFHLFGESWSNGDVSSILKNSLIRCMTLFLQAWNSSPAEYESFLLAVIDHATTPGSEESVFLLEDGLDLWLTYICRIGVTQTISPRLLQVFRNLVGTLSHTLEFAETCLRILDAYLLIGQQELLQQYGKDVAQCFFHLLGDIRDSSTVHVAQPIDRVLQMFPNDGCVLLQSVLAKLYTLTMDPEEPGLAKVQYLTVFARVCVGNPLYLFSLLDGIAAHKQQPVQDTVNQFFDQWFDNIDSISNSDARKLTAIALCNLIATPRAEVIPQLSQIITTVVGLRPDIDPPNNDFFSGGGESAGGFSLDGFSLPESATEIQLRKVQQVDPLNIVDLSTYLYEKMKEASNRLGANVFQAAIQSMHPTVLQLAIPPVNK
ncbi:hypothetical protein DFA_06501 [Cavenderia fasciculata]|uniref:Importin N-terminal domain-containing protein n=1 Tax=Cavenderia fasciculata TaxID=261658 RepID=F4PJ65_CACFS|nr:uncharacterized protein DFA_06501 [Cavenderia fasciculata]EGG24351.1 hypothetical protein DFA_06501 [Cavenderia fasciculata]|eukprot:XP_004362202.1 hypothetical protein DFA_06501 [Cavenderia fasciculata]